MNDEKEQFSEEFLNAFVDNQLTADEKAEAYSSINKDLALTTALCELRKVHDLVQVGYKSPPTPPNRHNMQYAKKKWSFFGIAASVLLIVGILAGLGLGTYTFFPGGQIEAATTRYEDSAGTLASRNTSDVIKVLVHVNDGSDKQLKDALDDVEQLMAHYRKTGQAAQIELIANGTGIKLLEKDMSPFPERIKHMQKEYANLTFVACKNTLDSIAEETGFESRLIPGVVVIDSGVAQIMRRQHQGWAYIQV